MNTNNAQFQTHDAQLQAALAESKALARAIEVSAATARARLQRVLELYNIKIVPVEADGNCQYRALSVQLYGEQSHHTALRRRIVQQLRMKPDWYAPYVQGPYDDYIQRME